MRYTSLDEFLNGDAEHTEIRRETIVSEDLSTVRYIEEEFEFILS